jgi:heme exporter protein A
MSAITPPQWAVEASGLAKSYGSHLALRGVDLRVRPGERVALFGPNGAGKTTLIKMLATVVRPSSGRLVVEGLDVGDKAEEARRRIGLVSHSTFLYNHLSIYENLDFYGRIYDIAGRRGRIMEVVDMVEMTARLHDRVGDLSRGMQQRVSIARAMLHRPSVMLLDEPETGLDQRSSSVVWSALLGAGESRRTVILITHNLERGLEISDRVVLLVKGRVAWEGPARGLDLGRLRELYGVHTGGRE